MTIEQHTQTPAQTAACARQLATVLSPPPVHIHLYGDLGAGKTLWTRALIAALGGGSHVPSPSFALALSYAPPSMPIHHLDLFRLPQGAPLPEELLELLQERALCLVEWPTRAADLPTADICLMMDFVDAGRRLTLRADSERGEQCLRALS